MEATQLTSIYLSIAAASTLFFIVAAIFGDIADFFDGMFDFLDFGDGILSLRSILLFAMGFGSGGAIGVYYGLDPMGSSIAGLVTGIAVAATGIIAMRALLAQQASTPLLDTQSLVGGTARVTVSIAPGKAGEITTTDNYGRPVTLTAFSNQSHVSGARVRIKSIDGGDATVEYAS